MTSKTTRGVGVDAPRTTPDEALELMTHHLLMAMAYYEPSPDGPETCAEMIRIMVLKGETEGRIRAARIWLAGLDQYYAQLREEQGP